jgi:flavorubredoxin
MTMETRVSEIADRIYRLSTFVPDVGPTGFTFNQFLIDADEPAIFHTGTRGMFPSVSEAVASVLPLERLRWIMFGHLEADECGAMNLFLAAAGLVEDGYKTKFLIRDRDTKFTTSIS